MSRYLVEIEGWIWPEEYVFGSLDEAVALARKRGGTVQDREAGKDCYYGPQGWSDKPVIWPRAQSWP